MERSIMASRRDRCLELDGNWMGIGLNKLKHPNKKTHFRRVSMSYGYYIICLEYMG